MAIEMLGHPLRRAAAGNPVWPDYFADPFVLRTNEGYLAFGTGGPDAEPLPVLRSTDLRRWTWVGSALATPPGEAACWAPEVVEHDGIYYLYYSHGGTEGEGHRIHVATATSPQGPYHHVALVTPHEPFAVDAHPFRDDNGDWYLFYARDFLEGQFIGTGIVVDRLIDMTAVAREPVTVVRPHAPWHLYEARRDWYGRTWDWYTVEGPFVVRSGDRYHCTFSGGAWRDDSHGVDYVSADHPLGPWEAPQAGPSPRIIGSRPELGVLAPGHGCAVEAPDGSLQLVYHAWDTRSERRTMRIDPLVIDDAGLRCQGPTVGTTGTPTVGVGLDGQPPRRSATTSRLSDSAVAG